jgi:hypothetical protein
MRWPPLFPWLLGVMTACGGRTDLGASVSAGAGGARTDPVGASSAAGAMGVGSGAGAGAGGSDAGSIRGCPMAGVATLVADEPFPTSVAVDATQIYWATTSSTCVPPEGQVRSMPKGGGPITTLADQQDDPAEVVVDAQNVYWYTACGKNHLRRVPKGGGAVTDYALKLQSGTDGRLLAQGAENLYFNDYGVLGIPKAGGAQFDVDNKDFPYGLAADDGGVYWMGPIGGGPSMGVFAFPTGATAPTKLATLEVGIAIALDHGWIYFDGGSGGISRIPRSGGTIEAVVANGWASTMATDGTSLYWADGVPGFSAANIHRTPVGGGADTVIAQAMGWVSSMVLDADCLYFTDPQANAIKAVAR